MTDSQCTLVGARGDAGRPGPRLRSPICIVARFRDLALEDVEMLVAVGLDKERRIVSEHRLIGTATGVAAVPRELLGPVLAAGSVALIAVHNHPSGNPKPSRADLDFTRRLGAAAQVCGLALLDHVIVASGGWCSMRDAGWVRARARPAGSIMESWGWP